MHLYSNVLTHTFHRSVQSPRPDPVQPRADHHSEGPHRGVLESWGRGDEEDPGIVWERHGCYECKHFFFFSTYSTKANSFKWEVWINAVLKGLHWSVALKWCRLSATSNCLFLNLLLFALKSVYNRRDCSWKPKTCRYTCLYKTVKRTIRINIRNTLI